MSTILVSFFFLFFSFLFFQTFYHDHVSQEEPVRVVIRSNYLILTDSTRLSLTFLYLQQKGPEPPSEKIDGAMLGCRGTRISHHFRECDLHFHLPTTFRFGYCGLQIQSFHLSFPWPLKPCWEGITTVVRKQNRVPSRYCCSATPPKPAGEIPLLSDCFRFYS